MEQTLYRKKNFLIHDVEVTQVKCTAFKREERIKGIVRILRCVIQIADM
jgi:hypothetical protein